MRHNSALLAVIVLCLSCGRSGSIEDTGGVRLTYQVVARPDTLEEIRRTIRGRLDLLKLVEVKVSIADSSLVVVAIPHKNLDMLEIVKFLSVSPGFLSFHVVDEVNSPPVQSASASKWRRERIAGLEASLKLLQHVTEEKPGTEVKSGELPKDAGGPRPAMDVDIGAMIEAWSEFEVVDSDDVVREDGGSEDGWVEPFDARVKRKRAELEKLQEEERRTEGAIGLESPPAKQAGMLVCPKYRRTSQTGEIEKDATGKPVVQRWYVVHDDDQSNVDLSHVTDADIVLEDSRPCLHIRVAKTQAMQLSQFSQVSLGRKVAVVLDGVALIVDTMHAEISGGTFVIMPGVTPKWEVEVWWAILKHKPLPCRLALEKEEVIVKAAR